MALGIYLGGTTGLADGTLEVPGDGSGLTLGAIGSVGTLHIRAASGKQNAEQVTVNAPTNCEVSADGITYAATAVYAIGAIQDTNVAIYVKRTAGTNALTTGGTTTPRLSLITEEAIAVPDTTAPVLSGTLVATAGDTQVTLSGPTATDAVGIAKWQYRIGTGAWVDIAESNNTTMPSTVVGSLINGTEYSFTVRALDAAGNASTASNAATATPAATHTDDFAGAAIDAAKWDVTTAGNGSVSVSGGVCTLSGSAIADGQLIWSKPSRAYNAVKTTRSKFKLASSGLGTGATFIPLCLFDSPTAVVPNNQTTSNIFNIPVAASPATQDTSLPRIVFGVYEVSGTCKLRILRGVPFGESPDLGRFWNGTAWSATVTNFDAAFDTYYVAKLETTATQYRASFLSADETSTIATTGWRDWTEIRTFESPTACRFFIGENATNVHYGTLVLDWFDER